MFFPRVSLILCSLALLAGCALTQEPADKTKDWPASKIYTTGKKALDNGDYDTAIKYFESLETRFPFGRHSQQAQLDIAYSYYKQGEADAAIAAIDRFTRTYPRHPHIDYAYYLRGRINFGRERNILDRVLRKDPSSRDPAAGLESYRDFETLLKRFPDSRYADDTRQRMVYLRNNLAKHEIQVADYYMRRGAYVAAANRAKFVIENFQQTPSVPDALAVLVRAYTKLELEDLRATSLRVLELNYPDHPVIAETKDSKRRWWPHLGKSSK